ncbi:MAG: DUF5367 family protein [Deltaproteobacteria bacterium]|nr:DUF5367 family protein [Deltaproteobacteria bacterium]
MRWLALGVVLAVVVLGIVRIAGPAILEPASPATRWLATGIVAGALAGITALVLARAPVGERAWAALALVAPGLIAHVVIADAFGAVLPMLQATSDRAWAALTLATYGAMAAVGLVMGRR